MVQKTPPALSVTTTVSPSDLLLSWSGSGPLKSIEASVAAPYLNNLIGGAYAAIGLAANGTTDDTAALVSNISASAASGQPLQLPHGTVITQDPVVVSRPGVLQADGPAGYVLQARTFTNSEDLLTVKPSTADDDKRYWGLEGLTLAVDTNARDTLAVDLSGGGAGFFLSRFTVRDMLLPNTPRRRAITLTNPNQDGLFTSLWSNLWINGGVRLADIGDSFVMENFTMTGSGATEAGELYIAPVPGAAQLVFSCGNITFPNGVTVFGGTQVTLRNNQLELIGTYTGTYGAAITFQGHTAGRIDGGNINAYDKAHGISVKASVGTVIEPDAVSVSGAASKVHIIGDGTTTQTTIRHGVAWNNDGVRQVAPTCSGFTTFGGNAGAPSGKLTTQNSWVDGPDSNFYQGLYLGYDSAGYVEIFGTISSGTKTVNTTIATIPAPFRPQKARYFMVDVFQAGGWVRGMVLIDTVGNIKIAGPVDLADNTNVSFSIGYSLYSRT